MIPLEDKPNVKGVGYRWMFDIDYLTDSMNYTPTSIASEEKDEEVKPEAQERKSQDDPLASSEQGLVTPSTTKVKASG
ncbi:hypothetical protein Tco_0557542, partial [Tanacetum coccineum]